ncbi:sulfite exporter TauE/SafE family protein [Leucobacter soli]|uniref:Probable membrane transporter protein n=3 Tax=Leucobacter soli TaxID=2812850 RepID=A0A916JVK3_9MICO|nr:sulfite exporter TauE/SafE family protein [Leucobacter soli]CAG7607209.1 putative membrane transporter protein [Leucobacter soli]
MEPAIIVGLALAVLVGVSLGLLGGGGSILTVPILTYVIGMDSREAIAASLFIVGATSAVSVLAHARAGRVRWRTGLIFGAAGMAGAFAGGIAGGYIPGPVLMVLFAGMMVATATAMIRGRRAKAPVAAGAGADSHGSGSATAEAGAATGIDGEARPGLPMRRIVLDGFLVGLATGLVGAGGGFLIVPALTLLGGLPMAIAVGTSLLVIAMKSAAGLAGYLFSVQLDWPIVLGFTAAAVAGSFLGVRLAGLVPERALRRGFGFFVLAMGAFVLVQELPKLIPT